MTILGFLKYKKVLFTKCLSMCLYAAPKIKLMDRFPPNSRQTYQLNQNSERGLYFKYFENQSPIWQKKSKIGFYFFLILTDLIQFGLETALRPTTYNMIQTASLSNNTSNCMCGNMIKILFYFLTWAIL